MSHENQDQQDVRTNIPEGVKDRSSEKLVGAKEALKQKLMRAVMKQAMDEIGSADAIAGRVMSAVASNTTTVPDAAARLRELLLAEVGRITIESMADADATARQVAEGIPIDRQEIQMVIDALRSRVMGSIEEAAINSIADPARTADEIHADIPLSREEVQAVIKALRDQLTSTVRAAVLRDFEDTDRVATEVHGTIGENEQGVASVRETVYKMLVEQIGRQTLDRVADTEAIAHEVRSKIEDVPAPVSEAAERVRVQLTDEARGRALESMQHIDNVVEEVLTAIGSDLQAMTDAVDRVRNDLIDEVTRRARESVSDTAASAEAAHLRIGSNPEEVMQASEALKDMLIQDISRRSTTSIGDDPDIVTKALSYVDPNGPSIRKVREAVKARLLSDMLSTAIAEIHGEVGTAARELSAGLGPIPRVAVDEDEGEEEEDIPISFDYDVANADELEGEIDAMLQVIDADAADTEGDTGDWQPLGSFENHTDADQPADVAGDDYPELTGDDAVDDYPEIEASGPAEPESEWAPQPVGPPDSVLYVYGIGAAEGVARNQLPAGITEDGIETVSYDGLSALVSKVPTAAFAGEALKQNLKDAAWMQENVRKHASIIEELRSRQTILPMPFCTVSSNREAVQESLSTQYEAHFDALSRVEGRQEWGLRVYRNLQALESRVSESDRRLEGAFGSIAKGVVGYLRDEMKRVDRDDEQDPIKLMTEHCTQRSHESLLSLSVEGKLNPDRGGQAGPDEDIVLNTTYLVDDGQEEEVRAEVQRLQAEYADMGFRFEITGPWPPYHFVSSDKARDAVRSQQ